MWPPKTFFLAKNDVARRKKPSARPALITLILKSQYSKDENMYKKIMLCCRNAK